ncbi:MAG: hypothetical protein J07HX64_02056 [halophilic archaeon J07HX64]|nr:MAG: hypothetical protein J07HX64_02056 [halophilic archaeon J07HX64]
MTTTGLGDPRQYRRDASYLEPVDLRQFTRVAVGKFPILVPSTVRECVSPGVDDPG